MSTRRSLRARWPQSTNTHRIAAVVVGGVLLGRTELQGPIAEQSVVAPFWLLIGALCGPRFWSTSRSRHESSENGLSDDPVFALGVAPPPRDSSISSRSTRYWRTTGYSISLPLSSGS